MTDIARLGIVIDSSDVAKANADLAKFARAGASAEASSKAMERASRSLASGLALVSAGLGAAKIVQYADAYQQVNARLRLVSSSQQSFNRVQAELIALSEQTRSSLTGTVDLYARIARSTKTLAASDTDRLAVTKAINQALIVSGAAGASAEAALIQLGQGFASGTLRGEELNSVMEQTPRLAKAIADGLGITIGRLRELGAAGKLTAGTVFEAIKSQGDVLESEFARIPVTIGQALGVAENRLQQFVGKSSEVSGAGRAIANGIDLLSRNLDTLAAAAGGFAAAKLAEVLLGVGVRLNAAIAATVSHVAALNAQRVAAQGAAQAEVQRSAAAVAAAQADQAGTAAKLAGLQATQAGIVAARAEVVSKLQSAQASATQATAQIAAAKAAGALSFALASQREGTVALTAAQARQVALTTELATLGRQQAAVQAQIAASTAAQRAAAVGLTAATSAQAAAQAGLATATTATGTAATIASRALGLLGGPIGVITTLLGLGASAWILWGNKAEEAGSKAEQAIKKVRGQINEDLATVQRLDALLGKLQNSGAGADDARVQRLQNLRNAAASRVAAGRSQVEDAAATRARNDAIERNELARRVDPIAIRNRQQAAFKQFMEDNATDTEKFQAALKRAKAELGDFFTPEVEARLRKKFIKPTSGQADAKDFLGVNVAKVQQELDALASAYQSSESIIEATRGAGLLSEREYYEAKRAFISLNAEAQENALRQEIALMAAAKLSGKDRLENDQKIAEAQTRIAVLRGEAGAKLAVLSINETAAAERIAAGFREAEISAVAYLEALQRAQRIELEGIGRGTQARDLTAAEEQIRERYAQQRRTLEGERRRNEISEPQFQQQLSLLEEFQVKALASYADYYAQLEKKQADFSNGATEAIQNYLSGVADIAKQTEDVTTRALSGIEDAFVSLATTGKADFKSLVNSIIADIIRMQARAQAAGLANGIASLFNTSSSTGFSTNQTGTSLPTRGGAATGTNFVERDMLTILHKGEAVVPKAYNPAANMRASGASSPQVYLNIKGGPSTPKVTQRQEGGKVTLDVIYEPIRDRLMGEVNNGGPFMSGLSNQTGVSRTAGLVR